jgi:hypothetical protein
MKLIKVMYSLNRIGMNRLISRCRVRIPVWSADAADLFSRRFPKSVLKWPRPFSKNDSWRDMPHLSRGPNMMESVRLLRLNIFSKFVGIDLSALLGMLLTGSGYWSAGVHIILYMIYVSTRSRLLCATAAENYQAYFRSSSSWELWLRLGFRWTPRLQCDSDGSNPCIMMSVSVSLPCVMDRMPGYSSLDAM